MKKNRQLILYLSASLFLLSGAARLIYEIVWEGLLELYFGVHGGTWRRITDRRTRCAKLQEISIDPLRVHTAVHNNMHSAEALSIYRSHLTPNGVLCAWMDEFHVIPHTLAQVFPYVDQYRKELMVARSQPIFYQTEYMERVAGFRFFQRDQSQILREEQHRPILRDTDPWLEYYFLATPTRARIKVDPDVEADFESRIR
jgi:hypothetical protein